MLKSSAVNIDDERRQQNDSVFNIYGLYRLLLSLILLLTYIFTTDLSYLGVIDLELYYRTNIF